MCSFVYLFSINCRILTFGSPIAIFLMLAICPENISEPNPTECYPIKGYMTASYSGDTTMNDKVEQALYDVISRGMSTDAFLAESVVRANFIGIRGTEEINELVTEEPPPKSKALAPSAICVGVFAVIAAAQISYRLKRKYSRNKTLGLGNSNETLTDVEINDNTVPAEKSRSPSDYGTEIYKKHSYNYDPSIASGVTQRVSNKRPKPIASPMDRVEETLSEDNEEDELQRVHP